MAKKNEELTEKQVKEIVSEYFIKFGHMPSIPMFRSTGGGQ